jgi:anti-anti-sigma regulatory factor
MTSIPERFSVIVLQPTGALDRSSSSEFHLALHQALEQAEEMVIVDLLWVERTDEAGIAALVEGRQQAETLGKFLSIQSMDRATHAALEQSWNRQADPIAGKHSDWLRQDLELFLNRRRTTIPLKTRQG